ncbi:MAG: hypothetical protein ACFE91_13820 [Promethearchaeota archaeon]
MVLELEIKGRNRRILIGIFLFFISAQLLVFTLNFTYNTNQKRYDNKEFIGNEKIPKISSLIGVINITNYMINETRHYHNSTIPIIGKIYKPTPPYTNLAGINVAIVVDGSLDTQFSATSNGLGEFQIDYRIPYELDVYSSHKVEVECIDDLGDDDIIPINHLIIYVNATSFFDITYFDDFPKIPAEDFTIEGFLKFDNQNGSGVPNAQINYNWFNSSNSWPSASFFTNPSDGSFSEDIPMPTDNYSRLLNLNLSYAGVVPYIDKSNIIISNIKLFSDIICIWNVKTNASEGDEITIAGQIVSRNNQSLLIYNRTLILRYDGAQIEIIDTDEEGYFSYNFNIPPGTGNKSIQINLINTTEKQLRSITYINITARAPYIPSGPLTLPPFMIFSLIFFPILAVVVGVLAVFGYRYYKKQEKESRVVSIPLESKFLNLKILKDTGRLEESISYLFNAIYMDLINAKYGRAREVNETIRDFAIISVKELRLTPAAIYPFIQKVEEIIYAKPFKIKEKDFYDTCELFSPVYFQLTGYNFTLNF